MVNIGERIYLISMIDDATSRLFARFVRHDLSEENMAANNRRDSEQQNPGSH
jgi:hypothetical protein